MLLDDTVIMLKVNKICKEYLVQEKYFNIVLNHKSIKIMVCSRNKVGITKTHLQYEMITKFKEFTSKSQATEEEVGKL